MRGDAGDEERPDYDEMSLPELEARERRAKDAFRDAFGDLHERINEGGQRVGGAAKRARGAVTKAGELVQRHHRAVVAGSLGVGFALGYRRRRVVAERPPSEKHDEYVLVRRERSRASPLRAAAFKLLGLAATEGVQAVAQLVSERRAARPEDEEAEPGVYPRADGEARPDDEDVRMNG